MPVWSRFVAVVAVAVVLAGGAQAAIRAGGPDCRAGVRCEAGRRGGGAGGRIEMPRRWNGRLLVFSHGYIPPDQPDPPAAVAIDPVVGAPLLHGGYAPGPASFGST